MTHAEAVTLMRNAWNIIMMVQSGHQNGEKQEALHIKEVELVVFPAHDFKLGCATNRLIMIIFQAFLIRVTASAWVI
jgi:hypothetical protein